VRSPAVFRAWKGKAAMKRVIVMSTLLGLLVLMTGATAAWADTPLHEKSSFSGGETVPAGELCDFTYSLAFTIFENSTIFGDPENPDRVITQSEGHITHTNLDTGVTLTEVDYLVVQFDAADSQFKTVGIQWHLRTANGKLVVVQAGQLVVNTDTGEIVKVPPQSIRTSRQSFALPSGDSPPASTRLCVRGRLRHSHPRAVPRSTRTHGTRRPGRAVCNGCHEAVGRQDEPRPSPELVPKPPG